MKTNFGGVARWLERHRAQKGTGSCPFTLATKWRKE